MDTRCLASDAPLVSDDSDDEDYVPGDTVDSDDENYVPCDTADSDDKDKQESSETNRVRIKMEDLDFTKSTINDAVEDVGTLEFIFTRGPLTHSVSDPEKALRGNNYLYLNIPASKSHLWALKKKNYLINFLEVFTIVHPNDFNPEFLDLLDKLLDKTPDTWLSCTSLVPLCKPRRGIDMVF